MRRWKKMIVAGVCAMSALVMAGCGRSSTIQVTGIKPVQKETKSQSGPVWSGPQSEQMPVQNGEQPKDQDPSRDLFLAGSSSETGMNQTDEARDAVTNQTGQIAVYVCGAVQKPGVYYLPAGSRVCDALQAAQGFTQQADSEWLNQAQIVSDGQMLVAYTKDETDAMRQSSGKMSLQDVSGSGSAPAMNGSPPSGNTAGMDSAASAEGADAGGLVNLNTASKEQLMTLPGIGEAKADAIIRYRTESGCFASTEDVMNISGIKNSTYEKIRDRLTV